MMGWLISGSPFSFSRGNDWIDKNLKWISGFMDDCVDGSISLPANASKARPVDVFRNGGKHLRMYPQVRH
jgi:hypothetical protein